jgi:hypothetical protein
MESGKSKKCPLHNQVLIIIHASGICYTDVHITKGALGVKFPHTKTEMQVNKFVFICLVFSFAITVELLLIVISMIRPLYS